jgi:hypothetical protein
VIENTISIAAPASTPIDPKDPADPSGSSDGGGGGGCVYNPNAPARFDMGFILLMVLSAKKAPFSRGFFLCLLYLLNKSAFSSD